MDISKGKWNWRVGINRNVTLTEIELPVRERNIINRWFIRLRPTKKGIAWYLEYRGYGGCMKCEESKKTT